MRVGPVRGWCLGLMLVLVAVGGCVEKASFAVGDVGDVGVMDASDASGSSDIEGIDGVVDGEVGEQDVKDAADDVEIASADIMDVGLDELDAEVDDASDVELVDAVDATDDEVDSEDVFDVDEVDLPPCEPSCEGIECGDDGCGGECWFVEHPCEGPDCEDQVCQDDNQCTVNFCNQNGQCDWSLAELAECCDDHEDCRPGGLWDDENPSTLDYCEDYQCVHESNPTYCDDSGAFPCAADSDVCTEDLCDLDLNVCVHNTIEDCCYNDGECDDGNVCTLDNCSMPQGYPTCVHTNIPGECDDQVACTVDDTCTDGTCAGSSADDLCNDSNECTTDACDPILDCQHDAVEDALPCGQFPLEQCLSGTCSCTPDCVDKQCGPDGCGGTCGQCGPDQVCISGVCPAEGFQCDDGNNVPWDGCTYGQVTEYVLVECEECTEPAVAIRQDGVAVVTWSQKILGDGATQEFDVFAQLFSEAGLPISSVIAVSTSNDGYQGNPDVAFLSGDGFVVVWDSSQESVSLDGDGGAVLAQRFDGQGEAEGSEFVVNQTTTGDQREPTVIVVPSGEVLFAWSDYSGGYGSGNVRGRVYSESFVQVTGENQWSPTNLNGQETRPRMHLASNGDTILSWGGTSIGLIGLQRVSATGELVGDNGYLLDTQGFFGNSLAVDAVGNIVVVWDHFQIGKKHEIRGQALHPWLAADGEALILSDDPETQQYSPRVVSTGIDQFFVLWSGNSSGIGDGLLMRGFNPSDGTVEEISLVSDVHPVMNHSNLSLSLMQDGEFIAVWSCSAGLCAQRFDAEGSRVYR